MLLEYNTDTNDEKMVPVAIELRRRVAGRRLNDAVTNGAVGIDELLVLKEHSRDERKQQVSESLNITLAEVKERVALARAEQQLEVAGQMRSLAKDINRASRLSKSRVDALSDLEGRIQMMRNQLKDPSLLPSVEGKISLDLKNKNNLQLERLFGSCPRCGRRIVSTLLPGHEKICSLTRGNDTSIDFKDKNKLSYAEKPPIYSIDQDIVTSIATFKPQPPRHCELVKKGCTFIEWKWKPPIIDGGLTITDYELSYTAKYSEFNKTTGKYKKWNEEFPSIKTSRWCCPDPVAVFGFRIVCLRAATEYTNFKIRCYNLRGWSDWVDMISPPQSNGFNDKYITSIFTDEPEAPSPPLYLEVTEVTSSCIHLEWQEPLFDGGEEIMNYIIFYTVKEKLITVTSNNVIQDKVCKIVSENNTTFFVIRNLPPDTDVVNLSVASVNKAGLISEKAGILTVSGSHVQKNHILHTKNNSRYAQLLRELAITADSKGELIDSSFFTGIKQRLNRVEHMRKLKEELLITNPDPLEEEEEKEWRAIREFIQQKKIADEEEKKAAEEAARRVDLEMADDDEMDKGATRVQSFMFNFRQRRNHFKIKIKKLEIQIADLTQEKYEIDRNRTKLTFDMKAKEKEQMVLKLEVERLKTYHGLVITSSILTGSSMQYKVDDYKRRIELAYEECIKEVAGLKFKIISGENRRQNLKFDLEKAETMRKDRMAKFQEFDKNYQKNLAALNKLNMSDEAERLLSFYFDRLKKYTAYRQGDRKRIIDLFMKVIYRYKKSAFTKWQAGHFDFSSKDTHNFSSVGSVLLQQSVEQRVQLQGLLREAISSTASIKQSLTLVNLSKATKKKLMESQDFKGMEEGIDHRNLYYQGMHFLYEGDGYAMENKFDHAKDLYETQILWIRSRPKVDIKMLAICHGRLGKMFLRLDKKNRAIVEFDRQLSLAKEINDRAEEAEAFYGLGTGYFMVYDYDNAIRYLNIAQSDCYERLNKIDKMKGINETIRVVENDLRSKILQMNMKLEELKDRLSNTTAEIEFIVLIERTTFRALELRKEIEKGTEKLKQLETQQDSQIDRCNEIKKILEAISKELITAYETDELEMWSALVHDQPQVVEIEELKTRLTQRSEKELAKLKDEDILVKKLMGRIKNTEDDINGYDQQLTLEEGALMKHSQKNKPFRCVGLCAANAAGNEVTGTATGGVEEFAIAEGPNVYIVDYHSGTINHVFIGDSKFAGIGEKAGHVGIVTCLLHDGKMIFSGSADDTVISWDAQTKQKILTFFGHEGSIVALAVEFKLLASSSADNTIRLWDKLTAEQMRVIYGHSKSVLSLEMGSTWLLSGSADGEVRLWSIAKKTKHTITAECTTRLIGHESTITCVRYGKMEILSGDVK
eukprot:gene7587-10336_t